MSTYIGRAPSVVISKRSDGLLDLWRSAVRHKLLFSAITGTCCVMGVLYILLATPQYRAEAVLRVQSKTNSTVSALSDVSGTISSDPAASDESEILTSRTVVSEAIVQTGAETIVETESHFPLVGRFIASRYKGRHTLAEPLLGLSGFAWGGEELKAGVFTVPTAVLGDKFRVVTGENGRWTLFDKASVPLAQGNVGQTVSFRVETPDGDGPGQLRIDSLRARPGVEFQLRSESEQTVFDKISKQLKTIVAGGDAQIRDPSILKLSYQADSPVGAQMMVNTIVKAFLRKDVDTRAEQARLSNEALEARLPKLKADLEAAEDRLNTFRSKSGMIDMGQQGVALITRRTELEQEQTTLNVALKEDQQKYHVDSPVYQARLAQLQQVKGDLDALNKTAANLPSTQREFIRLSREVGVATELYTKVLSNAQQLDVAAESTGPGVSVVDWAVAPEKQAVPRNGIVLLGSFLGGLFVSLAAVHLVSLGRKELRTPEEIDQISQLPRLAVVSQSTAQLRQGNILPSRQGAPGKLLAMTSPTDPSIEALRSLRSSLRALLAGTEDIDTGKVILFTGPTQGVGKSFVSSNFAHLLAETNASVLLIDADMRQGRIGHLLHGRSGIGLAEVLQGTSRVEDAITKLDEGNLSVLTAGETSPMNPSELLGRPAFLDMLTMLRQCYDFVVIDSPPVLPVSDALVIADQGCDLVLLVSRADYTGARQLEETLHRLSNVRAKVGGHIFNGFVPGRYGERDEYGLNIGKR
jgi:tyrosine-protein kinase Etk/Wzc